MRSKLFRLAILAAGTVACANAQWLDYPEAGTPLTKGGKPDLSAKAPRAADGKPDLSGVWQIEPPAPGEIERLYGDAGAGAVLGDDARTHHRYMRNLFVDARPDEEPFTPAAIARMKSRQGGGGGSYCLPTGFPTRYFNDRPLKIYQNKDTVGIFYEVDGAFRQIHTDGRKLPKDPLPSWLGYSTAHWEGDTLVAETAGFNDKRPLDGSGHPHSEALHAVERFHRRDFGHLDMEITLEDPVMLARPFTVKFTLLLIPNSDILENFCAEGERDQEYMRAPGSAKK